MKWKSKVAVCALVFWITACNTDVPLPSTSSDFGQIGNPTFAATDSDNLLITRPQYTLSYNKTAGRANWAYWHLNTKWLGEVDRFPDFIKDQSLAAPISPEVYLGSGFDRGHLCPSADRTNTFEDNKATFLMSNIVPQAPALNRGSMADFEEFCRDIVKKGYQAEVLTGCIGQGGVGSQGSSKKISGQVSVPAFMYKLVYFTKGNHEPVSISVIFPNDQTKHEDATWTSFITTIKNLESKAAISVLPHANKAFKTATYQVNENPFGLDVFIRYYKGNRLYVGPKGGCYYFTAGGNKTYVDRAYCSGN